MQQGGDKDPRWMDKYYKLILFPGCLRKCMECRVKDGEDLDDEEQVAETKTHQCHHCQKLWPASNYIYIYIHAGSIIH